MSLVEYIKENIDYKDILNVRPDLTKEVIEEILSKEFSNNDFNRYKEINKCYISDGEADNLEKILIRYYISLHKNNFDKLLKDDISNIFFKPKEVIEIFEEYFEANILYYTPSTYSKNHEKGSTAVERSKFFMKCKLLLFKIYNKL